MLNFGASKPRVKGGPGPPGPPLDPHLHLETSTSQFFHFQGRAVFHLLDVLSNGGNGLKHLRTLKFQFPMVSRGPFPHFFQ